MASNRISAAELAEKLGDRYVIVGDEYCHRSRLVSGQIASASPGKPVGPLAPTKANGTTMGPEPERVLSDRDLEVDEIHAVYARARAVLVILGYNAGSTNELKWRHWVHHLRERRRTGVLIEESAFWKIPLGGVVISPLTEPVRREIAFVRYGGRRLDYVNFAEGCKSALDHIKTLRLVWDDSLQWTKQHYHQVPGGFKKLEILFLGDLPWQAGGAAFDAGTACNADRNQETLL